VILVDVDVVVDVVVDALALALDASPPKNHATLTKHLPISRSNLFKGAVMLSFQRLDVYKCAIDFVVLSFRLQESLPRGLSAMRDQLRRAAFSIPLNIAEAAGKVSEKDRARYYSIARGSVMECAAVMDVVQALGIWNQREVEEGLVLLERLVSMLTRMCR